LLEQVAAYSYASCIEYCMNKLDNGDFKLDALTRFFAIFPIFELADGNWSKMRYLPSTYLTQVLLYQLWVKV
jgi:hypothetical protein